METVDKSIDTFMAVGLLGVVALFMAMIVLLAFKMPLKHTVWFFVAIFAWLSVLMFREHWIAGAFVVIVGIGGVGVLLGVMRQYEADKSRTSA